MKTATKVILGMVTAAAAGAAIGMLLAPEKGSELQKKIKEGVNEWMEEFSALIANSKAVASEVKDKLNFIPGELTEYRNVEENKS